MRLIGLLLSQLRDARPSPGDAARFAVVKRRIVRPQSQRRSGFAAISAAPYVTGSARQSRRSARQVEAPTYRRPSNCQPGFSVKSPGECATLLAQSGSVVALALFLHASAVKLFVSAFAPRTRLVSSATAGGFASLLNTERVDVAVVDPSVEREGRTPGTSASPLLRALATESAPPFVLFLSPAEADISLRTALLRLRPAGLAVKGVDDSPDRLRDIVDLAIASRTPNEVGSALASRLADLREPIRQALAAALHRSPGCDSVEALASSAGYSPRTVERVLDKLGLAEPRHWLVAGRVLEAHHQLSRSSLKVRGLVELMGYSSDEPLAKDVELMTGGTPSELRKLSREAIVDRISARLTSRPKRAAPPRERAG